MRLSRGCDRSASALVQAQRGPCPGAERTHRLDAMPCMLSIEHDVQSDARQKSNMTTPISPTGITLYGNSESGHSNKVRLALVLGQVEHHYVHVDIFVPHEQRPEPFRSLARFNEVPLLVWGAESFVQSNAVYVQWCGKIGWTHSEALGIRLADYQRLDRGMAIRRADYHYLLPTTANDELTLGTWLLGGDGKLTMERRFQLIRNRDQATVLRGCWKLVCIELSSGRPRRFPPELCEAYVAATVAAANHSMAAVATPQALVSVGTPWDGGS